MCFYDFMFFSIFFFLSLLMSFFSVGIFMVSVLYNLEYRVRVLFVVFVSVSKFSVSGSCENIFFILFSFMFFSTVGFGMIMMIFLFLGFWICVLVLMINLEFELVLYLMMNGVVESVLNCKMFYCVMSVLVLYVVFLESLLVCVVLWSWLFFLEVDCIGSSMLDMCSSENLLKV